MLDRCHHALLLLGVLAALPSAVGAVDIGERALLDAQSTLDKGDLRPISPTELTKAFESLVATGQLPAIIGPAKSTGDPRLGTRLKHLVAVQRLKGGDVLPQTLETLVAPVSTETVPLTLLAESVTESAQLLDLARRHGGVGQISDATPTVWVTLPSGRLEGFLDAAGAARHLDLQTRNEPFFGPATGEGGTMMKVSTLHDAGVKGQGVTVAVLDMGFKGYTELVKTGELPKARVTQAFGRYAFEERSEHGAACAEIVADIAPAADQVLVRFDGGPQSLQESLQWLRTQKDVAVVNASWGSHLRRTDGLDATDQEINRFVKETGVLWVNAAGNEAQQVWSGPILDQNGNDWIEFPADGKNREFLIVKSQGPYYIQVQWDDWGTSIQPTATQDLDAYLFIMNGEKPKLHGRAEEVQNGQQYPMEELQGSGLPGGVAALIIKKKRVDRNNLRVRVAVSSGVELLPYNPPFSLSSPASAQGALAVGAVDVRSQKLADYSSNGPSWDNRLKPEVSAPTGTTSQAYRLGSRRERFDGTSAAAPHIAGLAALLASASSQLRGVELRKAVEQSAQPMGDPQPNYGYGRGLAVARPVAGSSASQPPPPPSSSTSERVRSTLGDLLRKE